MKRLGLPALVVHEVALAVWLGCVVTAGLAAAIVFPTMRSLDPALPGYAAHTGEHWMLAAGHVANRIFTATDIAQIGAAMVALASAAMLLASGRIAGRRRSARAWMLALAGATTALAYQAAVLRPRMDSNLREYWAAAKAGDTDRAESARTAFSAEHPTASNLMAATAGLALGSLVLVVAAAERGETAGNEGRPT